MPLVLGAGHRSKLYDLFEVYEKAKREQGLWDQAATVCGGVHTHWGHTHDHVGHAHDHVGHTQACEG